MVQYTGNQDEALRAEDTRFMKAALAEARKAAEAGEVPIGAVIVASGRILARAHNQVELLSDSTAHAEILALTSAFQHLGSKYLMESTLYITLEPCLMCAGALYWSKIGRIVYGAQDEQHGYRKWTGAANPFHPRTRLESGVLESDCLALVQQFFRDKRRNPE